DLDATAFAAGQAGAGLVGDVVHLELVHEVRQLLLTAGLVQVRAQLEHQADVVGHAQLAEHRRLLRQVADAALGADVHGLGGDVGAVEDDAPGVRRHQPDDHVEAGGLAGAVRAEQADDFAGVQAQAEVAHHLARAVALAQPFGAEHLVAVPDRAGVALRRTAARCLRQDGRVHAAVDLAAALDAAGLQVLDHALATHGAARLRDADVAGDQHHLGGQVVVRVRGLRGHRR